MVNDLVSDSLIRIKNGYMAGSKVVAVGRSKMVLSLCQVLKKAGYLEDVVDGEREIELKLKYTDKVPAVVDVDRISKLSVRVYVNKHSIPKVLGGKGTCVISTPKGLMTGEEAKKNNLGGELICKIW